MSYKKPQQEKSVPTSETNSPLNIGDAIGGFAGYLRRAKASAAGLTAQVFGENGGDSDMITTLHLTKHLDNWVKVTIWMVKDRYGKVTKKDGEYIKLTEFIATVKRPLANNQGQVAQFFGENGVNSDAINVLNRSEFLDALVYVEMHQAAAGMAIQDFKDNKPGEELSELGGRLTPTETAELKKLQKKSEEAWNLLKSNGFFRYDLVLGHLGRNDDFEKWLTAQTCCHPGDKPCENSPVHAWHIPGEKRFAALPLCSEHEEMWTNGQVSLIDGSSPSAFAATQRVTYLQRWSQYALRLYLNTQANHTPTPQAVFAWALERKIDGLIPNTFKMFLV